MYTKVDQHPMGLELTRLLDGRGSAIRIHATYTQGEMTQTMACKETETMTVLRLIVYTPTGAGSWYLETWQHDNGYRADFVQISARQAKELLAN